MFPIVSPPITDYGALTFPRQLQRWLDVNRDTKLTRTQAYITLPAFTIENVAWLGYSQIVASFNYEGPNNFSISSLASLPVDPSYCLCIMWKDDDNTCHRYRIWQDVGETIHDFPHTLYTGQVIGKNFRFEIWDTNIASNITHTITQSTALAFYTSVRGVYDYRWNTDFTLVSADSINTSFNAAGTSTDIINSPRHTGGAGFATLGNDLTIGVTYDYDLPFGTSLWTTPIIGGSMIASAGVGSFVAANIHLYLRGASLTNYTFHLYDTSGTFYTPLPLVFPAASQPQPTNLTI